MYANHATSGSTRAVSLGAAFLVNGAILGGLILAAPSFVKGLKSDPTTVILIPDTPPPPPVDEPKPVDQQRAMDHPIVIPDPMVRTPLTDPIVRGTPDIPIGPVTPDIPQPRADDRINADPPPLPALISAQIDPRFANAFQPEYPSSEIRLGREGRVSVRVLIGADGRVKAVEQVSATSPAFFQATRRHAISNWRFRPATRGGAPEESWKVMSVRFQLTGG